MKYTKEEYDFLIENYEKYGPRFCSDKLNRNIDSIMGKARRMGLKMGEKIIHPDYQKISINNFYILDNKNVIYFLGYFWADGNIINYKSNNITHWRIAIEIKSDDAENIMDIFMSLGKWSIQKRKRKKTWAETTTFVTNNKELFNFLYDNDFGSKSHAEPSKILSKIPKELHVYFWRGYFDGDGSAGLSGRGSYTEFSSTYEYKFTELSILFNSLNINNYHIYKIISKKNHKSCLFKIYGKNNVISSKYLLSSNIGLDRKSKKLNEIINKYK